MSEGERACPLFFKKNAEDVVVKQTPHRNDFVTVRSRRHLNGSAERPGREGGREEA